MRGSELSHICVKQAHDKAMRGWEKALIALDKSSHSFLPTSIYILGWGGCLPMMTSEHNDDIRAQ